MVAGSVAFVLITVMVASGISVATKRRIGYTFLPAVSAAGIASYAFGACNLLFLTPYFVIVLAILSAAFTAAIIHKRPLQNLSAENEFPSDAVSLKLILNSDLAVFGAAAILFILLNYGRMYYLNDEFSHWGLAVKNMFANGSLAVAAESNAIFKTYPPFATAVCWLCSAFCGGMDEAATFVGMDIMLLACGMPVFAAFAEKMSERSYRTELVWMLPGVAAIFTAAVMCFKLSAFTVISVDTLLGMLAAYIVMDYFISGRLTFAPFAVAALVLTKETGAAFAGLALGICTLDMLVHTATEHNRRKAPVNGENGGKTAHVFLKNVIGLAASAVSWTLASLSWNIVKSINGVAGSPSNKAEGLGRIITNGMNDVQKETLSVFLRAWTEPRISVGLPLAVVVPALFVSSVLVALYIKRTDGRTSFCRALTASVCMAVGFVLYSFGVLVAYWTRFSDYEAMQVASFERYMGTYLTMWLLLIVFGIVWLALPEAVVFIGKRRQPSGESEEAVRTAKKAGMAVKMLKCASVISAAAVIVFFAGVYPYRAKVSREFRKSYSDTEKIGEYYRKGKTDGGRVLFIKSDYKNKDWLIANYNAAPVSVEYRENFEEALEREEFDYIYIGKLDDNDTALSQLLLSYFSKKSGEARLRPESLYRICRTTGEDGEPEIVFCPI